MRFSVEAYELAVDAPVAPGRVLFRKTQDQLAYLDRGRLLARGTRPRLGHNADDTTAVPAQ